MKSVASSQRYKSKHTSPKSTGIHINTGSSTTEQQLENVEAAYSAQPTSLRSVRISQWPFSLDSTESMLLDHYIQRFSRTYPAFSGPTNPFLRVILPLSLQSRVVLDSLLALGGVQSWSNGRFTFEHAMLKLRQKALEGCRWLINELYTPVSETNGEIAQSKQIALSKLVEPQGKEPKILHLLASCVLILLYEKLAGEQVENGTTHLQFLSQILPANILSQVISTAAQAEMPSTSEGEAFQFIANLFLYNDFVRSTSLRTLSFSDFYLCTAFQEHGFSINESDFQGLQSQYGGRFTFPGLISRLSAGDSSVTDADIAGWDGDLGWLPSFSLMPPLLQEMYERLPITDESIVFDSSFRHLGSLLSPYEWKEERIISEVYRITGIIYRRQCLARLAGQSDTEIRGPNGGNGRHVQTGNLPSWAVQLIHTLPDKSSLENTLLWPIGIIGKELGADHEIERDVILRRLEALEERFHMKHFGKVKEHLKVYWENSAGREYEDGAILFG